MRTSRRAAAALLACLGLAVALLAGATPASAATESLFSSVTPSRASDPDATAVTVGTKITVKASGRLTGVRFYKGTGNTGTHTGAIFIADGGLSVRGTFTNESASGWQTWKPASAVYVAAGTELVVAVHMPQGRYAVQNQYSWPRQTASLTGTGGVYSYGSGVRFPTSTYQASSYFIDPVFTPDVTAGPTATPTVKPTPTPTVSSSPSASPTTSPTASPPSSSPSPATSPTSTSSSPAPTADPGALAVRVSGNRLVDGRGGPVALRGVNVSGTEFSCIQGGESPTRGWSIYGGQPLTTSSTFNGVASWAANTVRVPLNEDCWLGINGVSPSYGGAAYRQAIRDEVSAIHAAGLYAVLDLHWSAPGRYAATSQQPMADADHAIDFWKSVAGEFKNDPAVVFDLYNEPYFYWIADGSDQWDCWLNGCQMSQFITAGASGPNGEATAYTTSIPWRTAGMQQLIDAVRSSGATQPIIVNGVDWANDLSGWLSHRPKDPAGQLIAGWHSYNGQPCGVASCWNDVIAPLAASVPVLVGETGDSATSTPTYLPTFLPWADAHGLNYLAWTWNVWGDADNVLVRTWDGSSPTAGEGTYYRDHLRSLR